MHRSVAIANEFLGKPGADGLTQMQLQKLVYIAHGWNLGLNGEPLVSEAPEAWTYGPVFSDLYDHTKFFGKAPINRLITPDDDEAGRFFTGNRSRRPAYKAPLTPRQRAVVDMVWRRYGHLDGVRLSAMTHRPGTPWFQTYQAGSGKNRPISLDVIRSHYERLAERSADAANAAA